MDDMVASESSVLEANLDLLRGMRLACFMRATGLIRDGSKTGPNTKRMSAPSDRFVQIVAAIAFARYLKLVLGRVAKLYVDSSEAPETKAMWSTLESIWHRGCASLARAVIARRSDVRINDFLIRLSSISLPDKTNTAVPV